MPLSRGVALRLMAAAVVLAGAVPPAAAHNGAVAIAAPVNGIAADGDLSDWPVSGLTRYQVARHEGGSRVRDGGDFAASFRVGWDPGYSVSVPAARYPVRSGSGRGRGDPVVVEVPPGGHAEVGLHLPLTTGQAVRAGAVVRVRSGPGAKGELAVARNS